MKHYRPILVAAMLLLPLGGMLVWTQFDACEDNAITADSALQTQPRVSGDNATLVVNPVPSFVTIPFTLTESNNISIRAVVNGNNIVDLMFHTAVDSVSLTTAAIDKMPNLHMDESVEVESWGGTTKAGASTGNRLQIEGLEWNDLTIFSDELSGPGTDGKFGPNLFDGKIFEINFDNRELVLHSSLPETVTDVTSKYKRLDFVSKRGTLYVTGELVIGGSKLTNEFMVHSGFGGTVLLDDAFVSNHGLASQLEVIGERELRDSFGNVLKTKKGKLTFISFGGICFADVPIEIFDGAMGRQKVSVLGGELLKRLNVIVDSANHHLYLSPSALFGDAFGS